MQPIESECGPAGEAKHCHTAATGHAFNPNGPEEIKWPRGVMNFGNVVFAISLAAVVTLVVLTLIG